MPRLKNTGKQTKSSPYKKVSTLHSFGFVPIQEANVSRTAPGRGRPRKSVGPQDEPAVSEKGVSEKGGANTSQFTKSESSMLDETVTEELVEVKPKKRGRPRKIIDPTAMPDTNLDSSVVNDSLVEGSPADVQIKRRIRRKKSVEPFTSPDKRRDSRSQLSNSESPLVNPRNDEEVPSTEVRIKKRGRPRKSVDPAATPNKPGDARSEATNLDSSVVNDSESAKAKEDGLSTEVQIKKRGRPRKSEKQREGHSLFSNSNSLLAANTVKVEAITPLKKRLGRPPKKKRLGRPPKKKRVGRPLEKKKVGRPLEKKKVSRPLEKKKVSRPLEKKKVSRPLEKKKVSRPLEKKRIGRPPKIRPASITSLPGHGNIDAAGLAIKQERVREHVDTPAMSTSSSTEKHHRNLNGNSNRKSLKFKHSHQHSKLSASRHKKVHGSKMKGTNPSQSRMSIKIKIDLKNSKSKLTGTESAISPNSSHPPVAPCKRPLTSPDSTSPHRKHPKLDITFSSEVPLEQAAGGMSSPFTSPHAGESASDLSDAEGRIRRTRKPSQKLIDHFETEQVVQPELVDVHHKLGSPSHTKDVSPMVTIVEEVHAVEEIRKCYSCNAMNVILMIKFHHLYCNPCIYMWTKYLSRNILPECQDSCLRSSPTSCTGCRAVAVNATLNHKRRVRLRSNDSRLEYVMSAIVNHLGETLTTDTDNDTAFASASDTVAATDMGADTSADTGPATPTEKLFSPDLSKTESAIELCNLSQRGPQVETIPLLEDNKKKIAVTVSDLLVEAANNHLLDTHSIIELSPQRLKENPLLAIPTVTHQSRKKIESVNILKSPVKAKESSTPESLLQPQRQVLITSPVAGKIHNLPQVSQKIDMRSLTNIKSQLPMLSTVNPSRNAVQLVVQQPNPPLVVSLGQLMSNNQRIYQIAGTNQKIIYRMPTSGTMPTLPTVVGSAVNLQQVPNQLIRLSQPTPRLSQPNPPTGLKIVHKQLLSAIPTKVSPAVALPPVALPTVNPEPAVRAIPEDVATILQSKLDSLPATLSRPDSTKIENSGPRVNHVSRSANMAQGEAAVVQSSNLRLSALPPDEKCKIWNEEQSMLGEYLQ